MSVCPECGKKIKGADKIKVKGVWRHHHNSVKKLNVKQTEHGLKFKKPGNVQRSWGVNPEHYSDDQLLKRAVERRMGVI
jgi:hypothetical protein